MEFVATVVVFRQTITNFSSLTTGERSIRLRRSISNSFTD